MFYKDLKTFLIGFEVRAIFQLEVVGGRSQQLEIILVNLDKTVIFSKENIYLGLKVKHFSNFT